MVTPRKSPIRPARQVQLRSVPGTDQVAAAVDAFLATLDLDEAGKASAAIARTLAVKLDQARTDTTGAIAMATAGLAKELRSVLDAIIDASSDAGDFVAGLFGA